MEETFTFIIRSKDTSGLRSLVGALLKQVPPLSFYVASQSDEFWILRNVPAPWVQKAQQTLSTFNRPDAKLEMPVRTIFLLEKANEDHLQTILKLQEANLSQNLSDIERSAGFLSVPFTAKDFRRFMQDLGVVVAITESCVIGYCLAKPLKHAAEFPLLFRAIELVMGKLIGEMVMTPGNTAFLGPVCVSKAYRGEGIMSELYILLCSELGKRFQFGITIIAETNPASLKAHLARSFFNVESMIHAGMKFHILVRPLVTNLLPL